VKIGVYVFGEKGDFLASKKLLHGWKSSYMHTARLLAPFRFNGKSFVWHGVFEPNLQPNFSNDMWFKLSICVITIYELHFGQKP